MTTLTLYRQHLAETGDPRAAARLTDADAKLKLASTLARDPDRSLTVSEAADYLGVSTGTVFDLAASGRLNHHRIGAPGKRGRVLFTREDLDTFRSRATAGQYVSRHTR